MKKVIIFLFGVAVALALGSCQQGDPPSGDVEIPLDAVIDLDFSSEDAYHREVWICHHPETTQHNQLCVDGEFPFGCYVDGDQSKFCWLLTAADCSQSQAEPWKKFCSLVQ